MPFYSDEALAKMKCSNCGEHTIKQTGRATLYCDDCNTCPTCGCPDVDGFMHYAGCADRDFCGRCQTHRPCFCGALKEEE